MKSALNAVRAACALLAMSLTFPVAAAAAPANRQPAMTLISTDTAVPYPFAEIVVNHETYHVTEGDVLAGLSIRRIDPGRVTLSNDRVLVAVQQPRPDSGAPGFVARHAQAD